MSKPLVNRTPEGDFLTADELIGAFDALSAEDKLKLAAIEAIRRRGTSFAAGELIHEAVCRALTGERNCPRGIPFMAFIAQTMRSIASHDRENRRREASADEFDLPGTTHNPEDDLIQKQDAEAVRAFHRHFDDDPEVQLALLGWQDGLRGAALREATGLNQAQLDYAIKRIRTWMRKAYPQGWIT